MMNHWTTKGRERERERVKNEIEGFLSKASSSSTCKVEKKVFMS